MSRSNLINVHPLFTVRQHKITINNIKCSQLFHQRVYVWYFSIQQPLHWYHSASFLHCSSLTCAFDPLPQAAIGQGIRARQAQILPLVGEIWHIILSLSHPLRIKFSCPVIFKKFALTGQAWIVESKAQTLYRQSLITGTYSAKCKW